MHTHIYIVHKYHKALRLHVALSFAACWTDNGWINCSVYFCTTAIDSPLHATLCSRSTYNMNRSARVFHTKIDANGIYARFRADLVVSVFFLFFFIFAVVVVVVVVCCCCCRCFFFSIFFSSVFLCVCFDYVDKSWVDIIIVTICYKLEPFVSGRWHTQIDPNRTVKIYTLRYRKRFNLLKFNLPASKKLLVFPHSIYVCALVNLNGVELEN